MNGRYFGCPRCKTYSDAGYRWAYWLLEEPGVVVLGKCISVEALFAMNGFWNPPVEEQNAWLVGRILPRVRRYLNDHRDHGLVYLDEAMFDPEGPYTNWVEEV